MSMWDCLRCWNTPCTCGYEYRTWGNKAINDLISTLEAVKRANKNGKKDSDDVFMDKVNQYKGVKQ